MVQWTPCNVGEPCISSIDGSRSLIRINRRGGDWAVDWWSELGATEGLKYQEKVGANHDRGDSAQRRLARIRRPWKDQELVWMKLVVRLCGKKAHFWEGLPTTTNFGNCAFRKMKRQVLGPVAMAPARSTCGGVPVRRLSDHGNEKSCLWGHRMSLQQVLQSSQDL